MQIYGRLRMENDNRVDLPYVASRLIGIADAKDKDLRKKIEEFREECLRNIGVNVVNEQWGEQNERISRSSK